MHVPAGVELPAASQNQCDLAHLASGVYCTIIIFNNTNLINFSFQFSMRYQTWFLVNTVSVHFQCVIKRGFSEVRCLCMCTEIHTLDETMFTHTRVPIQITHIQPTHNLMLRAVLSQPAKFALIFEIKCLQCRDTKMSKSAKYLSNRANKFFIVYVRILAKFYCDSCNTTYSSSCSKIDLKIADQLDLFPETIYYIFIYTILYLLCMMITIK